MTTFILFVKNKFYNKETLTEQIRYEKLYLLYMPFKDFNETVGN